jgi:hypothetical protein
MAIADFDSSMAESDRTVEPVDAHVSETREHLSSNGADHRQQQDHRQQLQSPVNESSPYQQQSQDWTHYNSSNSATNALAQLSSINGNQSNFAGVSGSRSPVNNVQRGPISHVLGSSALVNLNLGPAFAGMGMQQRASSWSGKANGSTFSPV